MESGPQFSVKGKYQKTLVQKAPNATKRKAELKLCVLHAMHMITSSQNSVSPIDCFRKAGFVNTSEQLG